MRSKVAALVRITLGRPTSSNLDFYLAFIFHLFLLSIIVRHNALQQVRQDTPEKGKVL